ncbi:MAG: glycosyltransferase family 4 protein, partial [Synechococcaceae cyanobacterium ELA182]
MTHIAWLGKKSPFCGNVTYGLSITEALRQRGHGVSFIHFDTPPAGLGRQESVGGDGRSIQVSPAPDPDNPEVALPYLVKSQVYTIPSPGAQRELRESLERLKPDLVHASLTLSPLDFRLPDLCQQLGLPLVATFHPAFDAALRNLAGGTQQLTYQLYAPTLARFDRVIVFSELQADLLERLGVRRQRLAVIPNGVDPLQWAPAGQEDPQAGVASELVRLRQRAEAIGCGAGRLGAIGPAARCHQLWQPDAGGQGCWRALRGRHLLYGEPGPHARRVSRVRAAAQGVGRRHHL